jgi:predicted nucleic acid-binding protein
MDSRRAEALMVWVMDGSIAAALGLPDEFSPRAEKFLKTVLAQGEVWVPPLWWYEISNVIVVAKRRKRLTYAKAMQLAELYSSLPVRTDAAPSAPIAGSIQQLALQRGLSAYDAAYLELAHRLGAGLASLDEDLERAARESGVPLFAAD